MSQQHNFTPPSLCSETAELLAQLGQYDDPFLMVCYSDISADSRADFISQSLESEGISQSPIVHLNESVSFSLAFCNTATMQVIADYLIELHDKQGSVGYLSVFRHNCLSKPTRTFDWAVQQLSQLLNQQEQFSQLAINDFTDPVNWPGISAYIDQEQPIVVDRITQQKEIKADQPSILNRVYRSFSKLFTAVRSNVSQVVTFELGEALLQLQPFIRSLPDGEKLWRYVLTGEEKQELVDSQAFINLDSILLLLHAKQHAPSFYQEILGSVPYESTPSQDQIHDYIHRVFHYLMSELLEAESELAAKQACFLRVLDVFYGIFDQNPWSEKMYELLVEDEDTACISASAYQRRFSQEQDSLNKVSALTQQHILELLDSLESYNFASYSDLNKIDKIFDGSRLAVDPITWLSTEPRSRLLLASILLYKDNKLAICDDKTEQLRKLVSELLPQQVIKQFKAELKPNTELPEVFESWLLSSNETEASLQAVLIKPLLAGGIGLDDSHTEETEQPYYELYSNISDFLPVLASCYWLQISEGNQIAEKVIQLSLILAPQATLKCFAKLHFKKHKTFVNTKQEKTFLKTLTSLNVDDYDQLCFEMVIAQSRDFTKYKRLVRRYNRYSNNRVELWDRALAKLTTKQRELFYLDVHRSSEKALTPLLSSRSDMLKELINTTAFSDEDFFLAQQERAQILFSDHVEFLPEQFHLPVRCHKDMQANQSESRFVVLRHAGESLELVADNPDWPFQPEQGEWPQASHYIVLREDIDVTKVLTHLAELQSYRERTKNLLLQMQAYLSGELSFTEFEQKFGCYSDTKYYDLNIERYSKHRPSILPQILAEPDEGVQLRLIRLLTCHKTRGKRVLADIAEKMFFNQCIINGDLELEEYMEGIEVADLTEDWMALWQDYKMSLEQRIMAVR